MDKIKDFMRLHFPTRRRLIQLYAALLCNAHIKGYIKGDIYTGPLKNACVPGLNCYSCPGAVGACPLGALQNALASSNKRAPYFMFGILLLLGLTFGRTICGFLCPFGLIQELLNKINVPKLKKSRVTHILSYLKYVILLVFVILIPLRYSTQSYPVPGFCKYICPAGTLEGAVGLLANPANVSKLSMLNILFTRKFIIAVIIIAACIFIYRAFCRFLCPLGAIYGLFNRFSLLGIRVDTDKCIDCGKCIGHCKMDICHAGDHECIHCGECIRECPVGAISYKLGKVNLISSIPEENETVDDNGSMHAAGSAQDNNGKKKLTVRQKSGIAWAIALIFLCFVLWFVNRGEEEDTAADTAAAQDESGETIGPDVGDVCPDFTAPVYGSDTPFTLSDHRGKVVVINFWATYCTPCCAELPNFDKFYAKYKDEVDIIALHAQADYDGAEDYLKQFDYKMPFGHDETGEIIKSLGGSTLLPMTVVVDQTGHIVYNETGSMTYEKLEGIVLPLIGENIETEAEDTSGDAQENAQDEQAEGDKQTDQVLEPGKPFPDFTTVLSDGSTFTLSEALKDHKAVIINLWASWCGPCKMEMPYLNAVYEDGYDDAAFVCLSIEKKDTADVINNFKLKNGYTLPMGQDTENLGKQLALAYIPANIIIDRFGNLAFCETGTVPSKSAYLRLLDYYTSDDYTETTVLDSIPPEKPDAEVLTDEELSEAVCPDGSLHFTTPTDDENCWPFIKAEDGGVTNSNSCKDPIERGTFCTAEMDTVIEAEEGDVFAFDYKVDSESYDTGISISVNGEEVRRIGNTDEGTYVYEFTKANTYDVSLLYVTVGYIEKSTDTAIIKNAALLSGDEAKKILAENERDFPKKLKGNEIQIDFLNAREVVFDDPQGALAATLGDGYKYYVSDDPEDLAVHIMIGEDVDPYSAAFESSVTSFALSRCETDDTGFNCMTGLKKAEDGEKYFNYISVYSDFLDLDNSNDSNCIVFANEENANAFVAAFGDDSGITWKYADGSSPSTDKIAQASADTETSTPTYTIHVVDENGAPVNGCILNVCTDQSCNPQEAVNGELTFTKEAYPYIIHVLQYPEGYEFDKETEYTMPKEGGEITITIPHAK